MAWIPAPNADPTLAATLAAEAGLSPLVAELLARRLGADDPALWLRPEAAPLCDPFAFGGMEAAVERLLCAVVNHEPITVFGDYDVDGITATATLVQALERVGATVKPFFPDRETEGYGLTPESVARCLTYSPFPVLIVTVDCGITARDEIAALRAQGIDVIVTDHHTPPPELPPANAIVNPRLSAPPGAESLCGCAVALMLVRALAQRGLQIDPDAFLDLAAVATIADVMPLTGQNRVLVAKGLRALSFSGANRGLRALAGHQRLYSPFTAEGVAFSLVPCINAAGRLGELKTAYAAIGLGNERCAAQLVEINKRRRAIEHELLDAILADAPTPSGNLLVVGGEGFHAGVVGIVAARLMERFGCPVALVCRTPDGGGHGSMRACEPWNAVEALVSVADLLDHFGGHAQAAGFSLRPGTYEAFAERLPKAFVGEPLTADRFYDADLTHLPVTLGLCRELERLEPYGNGNPKPIFQKDFTLALARPVGADKSHLQLSLAPIEGGPALKAIWFGAADRAKDWRRGLPLRAWFTLAVDTYREPVPSLTLLDASPIADL